MSIISIFSQNGAPERIRTSTNPVPKTGALSIGLRVRVFFIIHRKDGTSSSVTVLL